MQGLRVVGQGEGCSAAALANESSRRDLTLRPLASTCSARAKSSWYNGDGRRRIVGPLKCPGVKGLRGGLHQKLFAYTIRRKHGSAPSPAQRVREVLLPWRCLPPSRSNADGSSAGYRPTEPAGVASRLESAATPRALAHARIRGEHGVSLARTTAR